MQTMGAKVIAPALLVGMVRCFDAVAGPFYQWTDSSGIVHFTDNAAKIPKENRDSAEEVVLPEGSEHKDKRETPPAPGSADQRVPPSESVDSQGHNQEWWQQRVLVWMDKKAAAEAKLTDAHERLGREQFLNPAVGTYQRQAEIRDEISQYEEQVREAERMLEETLPEEAHKSGAPPGWLRR